MKFREEILFADKGLGREIREYIEARLEIPKNCQAFSLIFAVDQPVQIKCEYMPRPKVEA